jgi:hypothetical protein
MLVASCLLVTTCSSGASGVITSESALRAELPIARTLGIGWSTFLSPVFSRNTTLPVREAGCGNVYSSRGDAIQGAYVSLKAEFLTVSLISIPNASTDFSSLKRILLLGCLQAIRVQGKTTRAHYKPLSSFTTKTGVGVQATTTYAGG